MLRKLFRPTVTVHWDIFEKETVDEIIFRTAKIRNRTMLELMARGGMRIGEVLKLRPKDIQDSKLVIIIIFRHANLATTQRYLGKISDTEAIRWIDNL